MSRQSNSDRIMENFFNGTYYGSSKDKLRLNGDNEILDCGTIIGKFVEGFDEFKNEYKQYLILTLQDFKSQPSWSKHKKDLIVAAKKAGIIVIFVPELDMGFGLNKNKTICKNTPINEFYTDLLKIAKYSTENIKAASCLIKPGFGEYKDEVIAYTYNQTDNDNIVQHAEDILIDYIKLFEKEPELEEGYGQFVSLIEPTESSLQEMIDIGASRIFFATPHSNKYNTSAYIQLVNDISNKSITSINNKPVKYERVQDTRVEKFYDKEKIK